MVYSERLKINVIWFDFCFLSPSFSYNFPFFHYPCFYVIRSFNNFAVQFQEIAFKLFTVDRFPAVIVMTFSLILGKKANIAFNFSSH